MLEKAIGRKMEDELLEIFRFSGDFLIQLNANGFVKSVSGKNSFSDNFPTSTDIEFTEQLPPALSPLFKEKLSSGGKLTFTWQLTDIVSPILFDAYFAPSKKGTVVLIRESADKSNFEMAFQRSEAKFRMVLETAAQGILLVNIHGQITLVNTKTEQLFGYNREELLDSPVDTLLPLIYRDMHSLYRNNYLANPGIRKMAEDKDILGRKKDGSEFPIEVHLTSVEMFDGLNIIAFITDISEQRNLQNKIRRMEKLEAVGQLAGGIAHDFNNVLAGVIGLTELALRKIPKKSEARKNLKMVIDKSQGAAQLVKQLLAFSRQQVLSPKLVNLNLVIKNSQKLLQRYLGEDIFITLKLNDNLKRINADPSALDQIITNLCINARDAMPDGGDLSITTENVDITNENVSLDKIPPQIDFVKLTVADSGIGMRRDVQKHIFEPFFSTKEFGQGTGLGLATVYGLVEQHDGVMQFFSSPGEGTSFSLYFPAMQENTNSKKTNTKPAPVRGGNESILIIDDEKDIMHTAAETLRHYGYTVFTAEDGVEGLAVFEQNKDVIDLVISDVVMPKMGGIELKMLIQNIKPKTKFIHISAFSNKAEPDFSYLQKPFLAQQLLANVRDVLDRPFNQ